LRIVDASVATAHSMSSRETHTVSQHG
jgi:hypothetical protein